MYNRLLFYPLTAYTDSIIVKKLQWGAKVTISSELE